jgi:hypothetical protein
LLDSLEARIKPLEEAVQAAAEQNAEGQLLMTHPGVGPVVSLAYVLILGDWRRFKLREIFDKSFALKVDYGFLTDPPRAMQPETRSAPAAIRIQ